MMKHRICALLLAVASSGGAVAEDAAPQEPGCGEAQAYQRFRRPTHFSIERRADEFEYRCTLRRNKYRKKDPAVFRRECEAFVNEYIEILNRCENAGVSRFTLDQSREQREKQDSGKILKYIGVIPLG